MSEDQFHRLAVGAAPAVAAIYVSGLVAEDRTVQVQLQRRPALAAAWAPALGLDPSLPADRTARTAAPAADLATLRDYAQAVYTASDQYLAGLRAEDLDRELDLAPRGRVSLNWLLFARLIGPISRRAGEILAIRRASGLGGLPDGME